MYSEYLDAAVDAVKALKDKEGEAVRFPTDRIWKYLSPEVDIPSPQRPRIARQLVGDGYIEATGATTRAESDRRKGSPTSEYRLGLRLRRSQPHGEASTKPSENSAEGLIRSFVETAQHSGFVISPADFANFYLALSASPIVILAGISGTGKSWLPRIFAELTEAHLVPIAVKPHWDDSADLFGYTPTLNPTLFVAGPLTNAVSAALATPDNLVVVLLDEMNIAHVEHYFSDYISVVESRRRSAEGEVITDPLPLDLPQVDATDSEHARLRHMTLPSNLKIVGTANIDETTKTFSPKVLDRAFSIEFGKVDLMLFAEPVVEREPTDLAFLAERVADTDNPVADYEVYEQAKEIFDAVAAQLEEVNMILDASNLSFGYRIRSSVLLYIWHWRQLGLANILPFREALDLCLLQKVLPRIRGSGELLRETLIMLLEWLEKEEIPVTEKAEHETKWHYTRSSERVKRMIEQLDTEGATSFWTS